MLATKIDLDDHVWSFVSEEAKDLLEHLMDMNPNRRFTVQEAMNHPWFSDISNCKTEEHSCDVTIK